MHPTLVHLWVVAQTTATQPAPAAPARDLTFTETVMASMTGAFAVLFTIIPRLLAFIVIVAVGWFLSGLVAKGVRALLGALRFDEIARRTGIAEFIEQMNSDADASGILASAAKWLVRVVVLLVAFGALGLPAVGDVLRQFVLWLPNLIVALVVLVLGGLAARALGNLVRGTAGEAGFSNPDTLATVSRVVVWAFAIVVAVNQIGIATSLVNTLFMGVVGAAALAAGLAFGLGGRDMAARTLERWSGQLDEAKPKLREAKARAGERAREQARVANEDLRRVAAGAQQDGGRPSRGERRERDRGDRGREYGYGEPRAD